jgi:membrane fusion protein, multidrug efflux system
MDQRTRSDEEETHPDIGPIDASPPPTSIKKRLKRGVLIIAIAAIAGGSWFYLRHTPAPGRRLASGESVSVVAAAAVKGDIGISLDAIGTVTPLATVTVVSQISGQLVRVDYTEGQPVKKGDLLIEIDSRPYELALAQAQGALARDQALLQNAELDLKRYQELIKTNAIPRQQLDTQVSLVAQDKGNVISDQAQINTQKLNIEYCRITAPVSGQVGLRLVDPGNYVVAGQTTGLLVITQLQPITIIFPVAEDAVPQIIDRLRAGATLPVTALDRSGSSKLGEGTLKSLDNQINITTGTLNLRSEFANAENKLLPNQFVNVRLLVDVLHGATIAPTNAIQRGAPGTFVYVVNVDDTVALRPVTLGPVSGDSVAIQSGVSPGDKLVVDGADKLRNGTKISLSQSAGDGVSPSSTSGSMLPASDAPSRSRERLPRKQDGP